MKEDQEQIDLTKENEEWITLPIKLPRELRDKFKRYCKVRSEIEGETVTMSGKIRSMIEYFVQMNDAIRNSNLNQTLQERRKGLSAYDRSSSHHTIFVPTHLRNFLMMDKEAQWAGELAFVATVYKIKDAIDEGRPSLLEELSGQVLTVVKNYPPEEAVLFLLGYVGRKFLQNLVPKMYERIEMEKLKEHINACRKVGVPEKLIDTDRAIIDILKRAKKIKEE